MHSTNVMPESYLSLSSLLGKMPALFLGVKHELGCLSWNL